MDLPDRQQKSYPPPQMSMYPSPPALELYPPALKHNVKTKTSGLVSSTATQTIMTLCLLIICAVSLYFFYNSLVAEGILGGGNSSQSSPLKHQQEEDDKVIKSSDGRQGKKIGSDAKKRPSTKKSTRGPDPTPSNPSKKRTEKISPNVTDEEDESMEKDYSGEAAGDKVDNAGQDEEYTRSDEDPELKVRRRRPVIQQKEAILPTSKGIGVAAVQDTTEGQLIKDEQEDAPAVGNQVHAVYSDDKAQRQGSSRTDNVVENPPSYGAGSNEPQEMLLPGQVTDGPPQQQENMGIWKQIVSQAIHRKRQQDEKLAISSSTNKSRDDTAIEEGGDKLQHIKDDSQNDISNEPSGEGSAGFNKKTDEYKARISQTKIQKEEEDTATFAPMQVPLEQKPKNNRMKIVREDDSVLPSSTMKLPLPIYTSKPTIGIITIKSTSPASTTFAIGASTAIPVAATFKVRLSGTTNSPYRLTSMPVSSASQMTEYTTNRTAQVQLNPSRSFAPRVVQQQKNVPEVPLVPEPSNNGSPVAVPLSTRMGNLTLLNTTELAQDKLPVIAAPPAEPSMKRSSFVGRVQTLSPSVGTTPVPSFDIAEGRSRSQPLASSGTLYGSHSEVNRTAFFPAITGKSSDVEEHELAITANGTPGATSVPAAATSFVQSLLNDRSFLQQNDPTTFTRVVKRSDTSVAGVHAPQQSVYKSVSEENPGDTKKNFRFGEIQSIGTSIRRWFEKNILPSFSNGTASVLTPIAEECVDEISNDEHQLEPRKKSSQWQKAMAVPGASHLTIADMFSALRPSGAEELKEQTNSTLRQQSEGISNPAPLTTNDSSLAHNTQEQLNLSSAIAPGNKTFEKEIHTEDMLNVDYPGIQKPEITYSHSAAAAPDASVKNQEYQQPAVNGTAAIIPYSTNNNVHVKETMSGLDANHDLLSVFRNLQGILHENNGILQSKGKWNASSSLL